MLDCETKGALAEVRLLSQGCLLCQLAGQWGGQQQLHCGVEEAGIAQVHKAHNWGAAKGATRSTWGWRLAGCHGEAQADILGARYYGTPTLIFVSFSLQPAAAILKYFPAATSVRVV